MVFVLVPYSANNKVLNCFLISAKKSKISSLLSSFLFLHIFSPLNSMNLKTRHFHIKLMFLFYFEYAVRRVCWWKTYKNYFKDSVRIFCLKIKREKVLKQFFLKFYAFFSFLQIFIIN